MSKKHPNLPTENIISTDNITPNASAVLSLPALFTPSLLFTPETIQMAAEPATDLSEKSLELENLSDRKHNLDLDVDPESEKAQGQPPSKIQRISSLLPASAISEITFPDLPEKANTEMADSQELLDLLFTPSIFLSESTPATPATSLTDLPEKSDALQSSSTLKYPCIICSESFNFEIERQKHTFSQHKDPNGKYPCPQCSFSNQRPASTRQHINAIHNKARDFVCPHCNRKFTRKEGLQLHILKYPIALHKNKNVPQTAQYSSGIENQNPISISTADIDNQNTNNANTQELINLPFTPSIFLSESIPATPAISLTDLPEKSDVRQPDRTLKYPCIICPQSFEFEDQRREHTASEHKDPNGKYRCPQCSFSAQRPVEMRRHIANVHNKVRDFVCPHCDRGLCTKWVLEQHIHICSKNKNAPQTAQYSSGTEEQNPISISTAEINQSQNRYPDTPLLLTPLLPATPPQALTNIEASDISLGEPSSTLKHPCLICNESFNCKIERQKHTFSQHKDPSGKYPCPQCSFSSQRATKTREHISNIHNKARDFVCPHCDRGLCTKWVLEQHIHICPIALYKNKNAPQTAQYSSGTENQNSISISTADINNQNTNNANTQELLINLSFGLASAIPTNLTNLPEKPEAQLDQSNQEVIP